MALVRGAFTGWSRLIIPSSQLIIFSNEIIVVAGKHFSSEFTQDNFAHLVHLSHPGAHLLFFYTPRHIYEISPEFLSQGFKSFTTWWLPK